MSGPISKSVIIPNGAKGDCAASRIPEFAHPIRHTFIRQLDSDPNRPPAHDANGVLEGPESHCLEVGGSSWIVDDRLQ